MTLTKTVAVIRKQFNPLRCKENQTMRLIIAAALLVLPAPGFAAPPAEVKPEARPDKKICKINPEDTESRIRRRVCKTEAEWNGGQSKKDEAGTKAEDSSHESR